MDTFKKIYKAIVAMTVIAITVLCLAHIGVLDLGLKVTSTGIDETGIYTLLIAISILLSSFIFSRAANVIANRKNTIIAYFTVFLTLIVLLFVAVVLIFKLELNDILLQMLKYIFLAILYLTITIFIFEIPQANSSHGHFQIFAVVIITIAFGLNMFVKSNNTNKVDYSSFLEDDAITIIDTDEEKEEEEKDDDSILQKVKIVFNYLSFAVFIINPMMRVIYIDKDYSDEGIVDDIVSNTQRVNLDNTSAYNTNEKYKQQVEAVKKKQQLNKNTPQQNNIPVQEIHEKVVNPNFKQEDIPEAIIPTITDTTNSTTEQPVVNQPAPTPTTEQAPTTPVANEPVTQTSPTEQPVVNQSTPTPITEQTPTTPVVNSEPVAQASPTEQPVVNQAPPTDINPNNNPNT